MIDYDTIATYHKTQTKQDVRYALDKLVENPLKIITPDMNLTAHEQELIKALDFIHYHQSGFWVFKQAEVQFTPEFLFEYEITNEDNLKNQIKRELNARYSGRVNEKDVLEILNMSHFDTPDWPVFKMSLDPKTKAIQYHVNMRDFDIATKRQIQDIYKALLYLQKQENTTLRIVRTPDPQNYAIVVKIAAPEGA